MVIYCIFMSKNVINHHLYLTVQLMTMILSLHHVFLHLYFITYYHCWLLVCVILVFHSMYDVVVIKYLNNLLVKMICFEKRNFLINHFFLVWYVSSINTTKTTSCTTDVIRFNIGFCSLLVTYSCNIIITLFTISIRFILFKTYAYVKCCENYFSWIILF
jgi:hypothetical protein